MNRFWHSVEKGRDLASTWSLQCAGWSYIALELGLLQVAPIRKLVFAASAGSASSSATTSAERPGAEEKALRASVQNSIVLAVLFLGDHSRLWTLRMLLVTAAPVEWWYRTQAHTCRAVAQNSSWFVSQASGDFWQHILEVGAVLSQESSLLWCGFSFPFEENDAVRAPELLIVQDDMAKSLACMVWSMVCARTQRGMWLMWGWPNRVMAALAGGHHARSVVEALRKDYDAYVRMEAAGLAGKPVDEWLRRSSMRMPCVVQLVRALQRRNWQIDASMWAWLSKQSRRLANGVLCEDGFNVAKNSRVQKAWTSMVVREVTSRVHRYRPLDRSLAPAQRSPMVTESYFHANPAENSMSFKECSSCKPKADWYSPKIENDAVRHVDMELAHTVLAQTPPAFEWLHTTWLGDIFKHQHDIIVRKNNSAEWFLPLSPNKGSCCMGWPGTLVCAPGYEGDDFFYFEPRLDIVGPTYITIGSHTMWEGRSIIWRSPVWQAILVVASVARHVADQGHPGVLRRRLVSVVALGSDAWVLELGPGMAATTCGTHRVPPRVRDVDF